MKIILILILFFSLFSSIILYGQKLNYKMVLDIDLNQKKELLLFYDSYEGEFEKTEFSKFCIVSNQDTLCVVNPEVWVEQKELYYKADESPDDRFGIIRDKGETFIWLTGYQYGCCLNITTILRWTGKSLTTIFNDEFEVSSVKIINDKKYIVGSNSMAEVYGDMEGDFYFSSFNPTEYRLLQDSMKVDKVLTQKENLPMDIIEDSVDVYSATVVHINLTGEHILISRELEMSISKRKYGILSLTKLEKEYFKNFTTKELRIARNEIFAYHGYSFKSQDLKIYFGKKAWYNPSEISSELVARRLTKIESYNIDLIREIENNGL